MSRLRITSVGEPVSGHPELTAAAARLVCRAAYLGVLRDGARPVSLDRELLLSVLGDLADAGMSAADRPAADELSDIHSCRALVDAALQQTERVPMPAGEWPVLLETLGEDLLVRLLDVSPGLLGPYATGRQETPPDVATRLHLLALLAADLAGAYNDVGIRRWFARPRAALGGQAPQHLFALGLDPGGGDAGRLRDLAAGLSAAGAG